MARPTTGVCGCRQLSTHRENTRESVRTCSEAHLCLSERVFEIGVPDKNVVEKIAFANDISSYLMSRALFSKKELADMGENRC